jgi:hypothetical protein
MGARRLPEGLRRRAGGRRRSTFSRPLERPVVPEHSGLVALLRDEVDRLRALTGMPFPNWSV